jgi:hypothetical protein
MGAVTTVGTFLDALVTQLTGVAGLSGVAIYTGPVDHLSIGDEAICFAVDPVECDWRYRTLPHVEVFETYRVKGRIWIVKAGGGETIIKAARDRALALLEYVVDELAAHNTSRVATYAAFTVGDCRISALTLEQFVVDGGRDCRLTFTVDAEATFVPA